MRWFFLIAVALTSCGRADLQLQLETLSGDDPFTDLAELSVVVRQSGDVIEEIRQPFNEGGSITLGPIDRTGAVTLILAGYDLTGSVIARGEAEPELPERGGTCCVNVCFCTVARVDASDCSCGSETCSDC